MLSCNYVKTSKHFKSCNTTIYLKLKIGRLKKYMIECALTKEKKMWQGTCKSKTRNRKAGEILSERLSQVSAQRIKRKTEKKVKEGEKSICRRVKCKGIIKFKYKILTEIKINHLNYKT